MEVGGLITEVGWTEFDFLSHGEESSEVMAQLLGAFPPMGRNANMSCCLGLIKLPVHTVTVALLCHLHVRATIF